MLYPKKIWLYIVLASIIALVLIGGTWYWHGTGIEITNSIWTAKKIKTNQEKKLTKDWQMYQNDIFGFEFKYPQNWKVSHDVKGLIEFADKNNPDWERIAGIYISERKGKTVEEWIYDEKKPYEELKSDVNVTGTVSKIYKSPFVAWPGGPRSMDVFLPRGDKMFIISTLGSLDEFIQILSTFEFIEWQTYQNEDYGFEFEYPREWKFEEKSISNNYSQLIFTNTDGIYNSMSIGVYNNFDSSIDFVKWHSINVNSNEIVTIRKANIAGLEVYSSEERDGIQSVGRYIYFTKNDLLIVFRQDKDGNEFLNFQKSLSSFKFIEPVDTSNWQIYRNDEYGFEFEYPGIFKQASTTYHDYRLQDKSHNNISIKIQPDKLNVDSINSIIGGKVRKEYIKEINIDGRLSYYFPEGDMGVGGNSYRIPLEDNHTLQLMFVYDGGTFPNENKIISTFKFID